jgi:hypothetical protein
VSYLRRRHVIQTAICGKVIWAPLWQVSVAADAASCTVRRIIFPIYALLLSTLGSSFLLLWECGGLGGLDGLFAIKILYALHQASQ